MPDYFIAYSSLECNTEKPVSKESSMCQWISLRRCNVNITEGTLPPGDRTPAFETSQLVSECLCHKTPNDEVLAMSNPITSHHSREHISLYYCNVACSGFHSGYYLFIYYLNSVYFGSLSYYCLLINTSILKCKSLEIWEAEIP